MYSRNRSSPLAQDLEAAEVPADSAKDAEKGAQGWKKENADTVEGFGDDSNLKLMSQPPQEFGKFSSFVRSFILFF